MKLLLVLLVVLFGVWLWRRGRALDAPRETPPRVGTEPMVACARCGMHVPNADSVAGRSGVYCSPEHRREAEGA